MKQLFMLAKSYGQLSKRKIIGKVIVRDVTFWRRGLMKIMNAIVTKPLRVKITEELGHEG